VRASATSTLLAATAVSLAGCVASGFSFPAPKSLSVEDKLTLWATYYHVYRASPSQEGQPLLDTAGNALTPALSDRDWCLGAVEGTIAIEANSRTDTYNYAGRADALQIDCARVLNLDPAKTPWAAALGRSRYRHARGPYGDGIDDYILVPFRSIAVDPATVPFGSVLYIPAARGTKHVLPDGTRIEHDGYFFAADRGGAIRGTHIDVFCGIRADNCLPAVVKNRSTDTFEAYAIDDARIVAQLLRQHLLTSPAR
jgi:3D (Asp-Asp-Asp) domain-containing protein